MKNFETGDRNQAKKKVILGYNKNYTILALNCILKNSKEMILASEINRRCRKNNIEEN